LIYIEKYSIYSKSVEKSTIPLIYIQTLKVWGEPLDIGDRYIHPPSHIKRNLELNQL
jgi:hypothetical protein